jgi:RNA polymerase sigma-70 factor (ECF subfamily)
MRPVARFDRLSDEALLAAVTLDDADATVALVRRFQSRVYGLALAMTGDPSTAEDVAQQTFERAWRHAGSFDARRASVVTWLLTIARNLAIDVLRARRTVPVAVDVLDQLVGPAEIDPESEAIAMDQLARVRVRLAQLPMEQRRAVVLATVLGRTSREIAEIEGIPTPTAKTRLRTGLRRLRDGLAAEVEP